ncbi:hypothetical protein G5I_03965 [Acromyrmex echinatior]|uniref:Uncharacterized protein n=1 Tax=Acromyrmex echinatior TaxID=103372 RepID=F4WEF9_ACREC|nr:hypothetical protein G5I_03965 [Acromyrmex echinatior]
MIDHQRDRHEAVLLINACPWSKRASSNVYALAQLKLYSTTSLDALVRTTGAAWENEGGKAEVDARSRRELATRRERETRGDKEKEGKTNEQEETAREKRRSLRLGVDSPIDPPV